MFTAVVTNYYIKRFCSAYFEDLMANENQSLKRIRPWVKDYESLKIRDHYKAKYVSKHKRSDP